MGDPIYETYARKSISALWKIRDEKTGLLGNVMNVKTGTWVSKVRILELDLMVTWFQSVERFASYSSLFRSTIITIVVKFNILMLLS